MRHSTSRGGVGAAEVEWRRTKAALVVDSRRVDRLDGTTDEVSPIDSGTIGSFDEVVLLRLRDGRFLTSRLETSEALRSPTCEILSSGVTSDSITVGKLRLRDESE